MSVALVVTCDGDWQDGAMPCRGAFPTREATVPAALFAASEAGWSVRLPSGTARCPAHTRAARTVAPSPPS